MSRFVLQVLAEFVTLSSRTSARLGWLGSFLLGVALPAFMMLMATTEGDINGLSTAQYFADTPTQAAGWSLWLRNFFVIRAFLVVLAAQSTAGELASGALRETLLRSVPRSQVLFAKWFALSGWDALALTLLFVPSAVIGALSSSGEAAWLNIVFAFAINWGCDLGLFALTLAIALITRSMVGTVGTLLVGLVLDYVLGWFLFILSNLPMVAENPVASALVSTWPALPNAAFNLWSCMMPDGVFELQTLGSLLVITTSSLLVALIGFTRMDVN